MENIESVLNLFKQNDKLSIRLISPDFGHLSQEMAGNYSLTHRKPFYFLFFMLEGLAQHGVDLQQFDIKNNELLFVLPNQIHALPATKHGKDYFKLGFDENCLSLLPKQYPFLINPFNKQKIEFTASVASRLKSIFELLAGLLSEMDTSPDLILAHLNSLLTEINAAYFATEKSPATTNFPNTLASNFL